MKKLLLVVAMLGATMSLSAQETYYKETFDTNSLDWTECAYSNGIGTAIIEKGVMSISSKGVKKGLSALLGQQVGENTFFETHCYAPLDMQKPFEINAKVNIKKLAEDRLVGFVFNYRDGGNFYAFSFNDDFVKFRRYENNELVGDIMQGYRTQNKRRQDVVMTLVHDGQTLIFKIDGVAVFNIRYMPLQYSGFGFYTFGNQEMIVDEVEFRQ